MAGIALGISPSYLSGTKFNPLSVFFGLNRPIKVGGIGDSIMAGDGQPTGENRVGSWLSKASVLCKGKMAHRIYGHGGGSAVGYLTAPYKQEWLDIVPELMLNHYGHNDMSATGVPLTSGERTTIRNAVLTTSYDALSNGVTLVAFPQLVYTVGKNYTEIDLHNEWLTTLPSIDDRFVFIPGFNGLYDPASSTYTDDGIHPNQTASDLMAKSFADWFNYYGKGITDWYSITQTLGATGRLYNKSPMTVPFCAANGGGYGSGGFSESVNLSSGLGVNTLNVSATGNGNFVCMWDGYSTTSYRNKWYITSLKIKANLLAQNRLLQANTYSVGSPDGNIVVHLEGALNTRSEWCDLIMLNKGTATETKKNIQLLLLEKTIASTTDSGSIELGEIKIYDVAAVETALGIDFNLP